MKKTQIDWDLFYLQIARAYSRGSKDPSTKVGALLVGSDNRLRAAGYNNFDRDHDDDPSAYHDRDEKLKYMKHAEIACLESFPHSMDHNFSLYVYPFQPCLDCASAIVVDGRVKRIVTTDYVNPRWNGSFEKAMEVLSEAEVPVLKYALPSIT